MKLRKIQKLLNAFRLVIEIYLIMLAAGLVIDVYQILQVVFNGWQPSRSVLGTLERAPELFTLAAAFVLGWLTLLTLPRRFWVAWRGLYGFLILCVWLTIEGRPPSSTVSVMASEALFGFTAVALLTGTAWRITALPVIRPGVRWLMRQWAWGFVLLLTIGALWLGGEFLAGVVGLAVATFLAWRWLFARLLCRIQPLKALATLLAIIGATSLLVGFGPFTPAPRPSIPMIPRFLPTHFTTPSFAPQWPEPREIVFTQIRDLTMNGLLSPVPRVGAFWDVGSIFVGAGLMASEKVSMERQLINAAFGQIDRVPHQIYERGGVFRQTLTTRISPYEHVTHIYEVTVPTKAFPNPSIFPAKTRFESHYNWGSSQRSWTSPPRIPRISPPRTR